MKDHLINDEIRMRELRMIGNDGEQLGVMSNMEAKRLAEEAGLDLVLISPQANPPVCKIMDYGKYKYETMKKNKEAKRNQKVVELKEVWLSATIDKNDMVTKANHAKKFLDDGDRVKVSIRLKGRQMARPEAGVKVMEEFMSLCTENGVLEKSPNLEGRNISMVIVSKTK